MSSPSIALSVNLNKVALVRNTRHLGIPSLTRAASLCLQAGAAGITVHPRPDERHIRAHDVVDLATLMRDWPDREFNIEGNPLHNLLACASDIRARGLPVHQLTFVPDGEGQFTSDHGWNFPADAATLGPLIAKAQALGARVGLMDGDIYGPSIPLMMGIQERPSVTDDDRLIPPTAHGVKLMSMGFLLEPDQAVIWRGPMIQKTIQQFVSQVDWGELDYLLVDLPPGTGDAQLSLCQTVALDGGVVITTPQEASVGVVRKGITLFEKVQVPILGIIENMSWFIAPDGSRLHPFGEGGGRREAERRQFPFLGEIPLDTTIREGGDLGIPVVIANPDNPASKAFLAVARSLRERLG
jgi:Mrp family chromosome partitioning ATPase